VNAKRKTLTDVTIKSLDRGEVSAVFSTFNVIDKDGDVTEPGAFTDGQEVLISAYGHSSWGGVLPVGKGTIRQTDDEGIFDGAFFMDTTQGRDTFEVVKQLGPKGEWSYGFDVVEESFGKFDDRDVRFLKRLDVHEVSPVLIGSGVNTRTLATKGKREIIVPEGFADEDPTEALRKALPDVEEYKGAIRPHTTDVRNVEWSAAGVDVEGAGVTGLRSMHAWVDTAGDPEAPGNYRYLHHEAAGGPANLRACLAGVARLNGAQGAATVPEVDREGVYRHLASHIIDAGRTPPELRSAGSGEVRFFDELIGHLAGLSEIVAGAERVVALRAQHGKELSHVNAEVLEWIYGDMKRLRRLLDTPEEDFAREMLRAERLRFQQF
jgi:HK97 family phage prohead protease